MNGVVFNRPIADDPSSSFLEQVKKNDEAKKRKNLKLISTIILSNLLVAYLFYSPTNQAVQTPGASTFIRHPGYRMMVLNVVPLIQLDETAKERKISLLSSQKKIVLSLGYIHEEMKNDLDPSVRRFKIEIPEHQTLEIGALSEEKLIAIPAVEVSRPLKGQKGSQYEINI